MTTTKLRSDTGSGCHQLATSTAIYASLCRHVTCRLWSGWCNKASVYPTDRQTGMLLICSSSRVAHRKGTSNGQKRIEAEQSSYYREYPVAFGQKREIVGVGQSDMGNNTLYRYCFQVYPFLAKKAPDTHVFVHCPSIYGRVACNTVFTFVFVCI